MLWYITLPDSYKGITIFYKKILRDMYILKNNLQKYLKLDFLKNFPLLEKYIYSKPED